MSNTLPTGNIGYFYKPFSIKGRISRKEFILSFIVFMIIWILGDFLLDISFDYEIPFVWVLWACDSYFIIAQGIKRVHDSGLPALFYFIPIYNIYLCFFKKGEHGSNEYGSDPILKLN